MTKNGDNRSKIRERILRAEQLSTRFDRYQDEKRKWLSIPCPKCGRKIEFIPKPSWNGKLRCYNCGIVTVPLLSHFVQEEENDMSEKGEIEVPQEQPTEAVEATPTVEADEEVAKKYERVLDGLLKKVEIHKLKRVSRERMNPKDPCTIAYEVAPRKGVLWVYEWRSKPGARLVLGVVKGKEISKVTLKILPDGIFDKDGVKVSLVKVVSHLKEYIKARGW
jgi:hypothetical protein